MAEKAGFGFNPNAYGLSAAGQEGSGMNQILTPYDPTKFDRAIVATGEKKKEDAAKQKDVVKPKVEFTDIKKGWQGYFVEEGITLDEKQRDLARKKVDWKVKFDELDPKSADYEKTKNEMLRESANIEYDIESLNFTADQMLQNKEIIDKSTNSIMINPSKYDDVASKKLNTYVQNLPTDQQTQYLQNNILNVPKVDFNWNENFLTPTGGYIKEMFERTIGSPIVGSTVDDNGNFIYKTQKGTSVPLTDLKPTLEALLADTVATTPGLYEYLLGRTTADGKSYAQLAAEAGYDNGNPASFVKYLFKEQTEEFVKQVIPLGDSVTTQQILQPYKGGGNVTITNVTPGTSAGTTGGGQAGSTWNPSTYQSNSATPMIAGSTIPSEAIIDATGNQAFTSYRYDAGQDKYIEQQSISGSGAGNYQLYYLPVARVDTPKAGIKSGDVLTVSNYKRLYALANNTGRKPSEVISFSPYTYQPATTNGVAGNALQPLTTNTNITDSYKQGAYNNALMIDDFWDYYNPNKAEFNNFSNANAVAQVSTYYATKKASNPSFTPKQAFADFNAQMSQNKWSTDKTFQFLMGQGGGTQPAGGSKKGVLD